MEAVMLGEATTQKSTAPLQLFVGQWVALPSSGLGQITGTETMEHSGVTLQFLTLYFPQSKMTRYIAAEKIGRLGLRTLISPDSVEKIIAVLKKGKNLTQRYRKDTEGMLQSLTSSTDPVQWATVISAHKNEEDFTYTEQKFYIEAFYNLSTELSVILQCNIDTIKKLLRGIIEVDGSSEHDLRERAKKAQRPNRDSWGDAIVFESASPELERAYTHMLKDAEVGNLQAQIRDLKNNLNDANARIVSLAQVNTRGVEALQLRTLREEKKELEQELKEAHRICTHLQQERDALVAQAPVAATAQEENTAIDQLISIIAQLNEKLHATETERYLTAKNHQVFCILHTALTRAYEQVIASLEAAKADVDSLQRRTASPTKKRSSLPPAPKGMKWSRGYLIPK